MPNPNCTVPECSKPARSAKATLCPMHYHRQYRHGSTDAEFRSTNLGTERLYRSKYEPDHPLAMKNGKVYVHRKILFDEIGPGTHECHWCKADVAWGTPGISRGTLIVDHLNDNKGDNEPTNLAPSCYGCNSGRAIQAQMEYLRDKQGMWSGNDTIAALRDPSKRRRKPIAA